MINVHTSLANTFGILTEIHIRSVRKLRKIRMIVSIAFTFDDCASQTICILVVSYTIVFCI